MAAQFISGPVSKTKVCKSSCRVYIIEGSKKDTRCTVAFPGSFHGVGKRQNDRPIEINKYFFAMLLDKSEATREVLQYFQVH